MDLLDFDSQSLYFEEALPEGVDGLIRQASGLYAEGGAEPLLLQAFELAPESLNVLVSLYRFYYYQHRLEDALGIAGLALGVTARKLGLPLDWAALGEPDLDRAGRVSMEWLRFHLFSLKAAAYLRLRLGQREEGGAILQKLVELDGANRIGAKQLLEAIAAE